MDTTKEEDVGEENRTVVCQGAAVIRRGWKRKKRYLTLFNDILVVSSKLSMEQTIWWYFFLQRSIREAKKHNITELPMQIFTEDIACCDTPLYVTATNFNMVNDIISKLLPMIRKHNIEDYQLWFCPGPGKAPRVLQGHEYPHDIRMINIQKNFISRDLRNFTAFPSLPGVIMKYLNADIHGKFILKPRNSARSQQQKNMKEKTFKKQRTSMTSQVGQGLCAPPGPSMHHPTS
nr:rho GTPase-activating protein 20-like isoform X2 [Rattus norvegicus]